MDQNITKVVAYKIEGSGRPHWIKVYEQGPFLDGLDSEKELIAFLTATASPDETVLQRLQHVGDISIAVHSCVRENPHALAFDILARNPKIEGGIITRKQYGAMVLSFVRNLIDSDGRGYCPSKKIAPDRVKPFLNTQITHVEKLCLNCYSGRPVADFLTERINLDGSTEVLRTPSPPTLPLPLHPAFANTYDQPIEIKTIQLQ